MSIPERRPGAKRSGRLRAVKRLSDQHRKLPGFSALSAEVITARGYQTITDDPALVAAYGFDIPVVCRSGLLIPLHDVNGEVWGHQFRPDKPRLREAKFVKYEIPKDMCIDLDFSPGAIDLLRDKTNPIVVTEGSRKADAAASAGYAAIALLGVGNWRCPSWKLLKLSGRDVFIIFDSDATTNPKVRAQRDKLAAMLRELGAHVGICTLEPDGGEKVGLDDYLADGGDLQDLLDGADFQPSPNADVLVSAHRTDTGNAQRLVALYGDVIRYCPAWKSWLIWNGHIWERDKSLIIRRMAKAMITQALKAASALPANDDRARDQRDKLMKWLMSSESEAKLHAMVENAQSEVVILPEKLDAEPYLFCCENGTLDLRTGKLREHNQEDLITLMAPVRFDPGATDPHWEELLDRFVRPDDGKEAFLARAVCESLSGTTNSKCFINLFDEANGDTGKTTFTEALLRMVGPYGEVVNAEAFLTNPHGMSKGIRSDIATLAGKRLVVSAEIPPGRRLDTSLMKKLTQGGGSYQFERKYENPWTGLITFTIWLDGNDVAKANVEDNPLFNRWRLAPFRHKIQKKNVDRRWLDNVDTPNFRAAILAWALRERAAWLKDGVGSAPSVDKAVARIRREMDPLADFWREVCEFGRDDHQTGTGQCYFATTAALYTRYVTWFGGRSMGRDAPIGEKNFLAVLKAHKVVAKPHRVDGKLVKGWGGVRLRTSAGPKIKAAASSR